MKNITFMSNTPKYSFLRLVMWHQYPSATITHFSTISYHISTQIPSKTSLVRFFLSIFADLLGSFSCYLDVILGILKSCKTED